MTRRAPLALSAAIIAALALAGCSAGATAKVSASATKVTLASSSGDPAEIAKTQDAHIGDVIATDADGRAQLDYADGSLTRVGPNTKLTVKHLDSASAQRTSVAVDSGQTWHRVKKLVADGSQYEVSTPVGVAAVKGTAFEVDCVKKGGASCTITVLDGVVKFTTKNGKSFDIHPYQRLLVPNPDGGSPVVTAAPVDAINADDWISTNMSTDRISRDAPAEAASYAGDWNFDFTLTSTDSPLTNLSSTEHVDFSFAQTICDPACTIPVTSDNKKNWTFSVTKDGILGKKAPAPYHCRADGEGAPEAFTYSIELTATRNSVDDIPGLTGQEVIHFVHNPDWNGSCDWGHDDFDLNEDVVITPK